MRVFVTKKASESRRQLNTRQAGKHAKFSAKMRLNSAVPQSASMDRCGLARYAAFGAAQTCLRVVQTDLAGAPTHLGLAQIGFRRSTDGGGRICFSAAALNVEKMRHLKPAPTVEKNLL